MARTESRSLEVRCGIKKQGDTKKVYVHMLNGTLCATERALCCIVENYQTPEVRRHSRSHSQPRTSSPCLLLVVQGVVIPEPMRKYMQGREFLPYVRDLPTTSAAKPAKKKH